MIVGLTGGIGSGKSVVAKMLAGHGAVVIDTDVLARDVVEPPSAALDDIVGEFGPEVLTQDGRLNRDAVAKLVFSDEAKRRRLNEITHPEILKRALAQLGKYPPSTVVVVVVPLLFESGFERNCQRVIAVVAPADVRLARVIARDRSEAVDVKARMRAQLPDVDYERDDAIVIRNDGDMDSLKRQVDAAWLELSQ